MKQIIKKLIPADAKQNLKDDLGVPSLSAMLKHLKRIGFDPKVAFDIGAYEGTWAAEFLSFFPNCKIFMVEAQEQKRKILENFCKSNKQVEFAIQLLSSQDGLMLPFLANETGSHVATTSTSENKIKSLTLETLRIERNIGFPEFIKLDVQGFELEVLKGAATTLQSCEFCLLETTVYVLDNSPSILQAMQFMDERGFQVYDIGQVYRRPFDKALFQIDILFIRKTSKFIAEKRWN